jgi:copper homeostasis protein
VKLEVCIDRIDSAFAAKAGGADRIEVCGALRVGGITPSVGLIEQCVAIGGINVVVMIRPHGGGFCYEAADVQTMIGDIRQAKQLGVQGVVLGALRPDGQVDPELCRRFCDEAHPLQVTFHRAFDLTPDPQAALDCLIELGIDRVLTSGQAETGKKGAALIRVLVDQAGTAIFIMAGGGIQPENVAALVRETGVQEVHASASEPVASEVADPLGLVHTSQITNPATVRALVEALREVSSDAGLQKRSAFA